MDYTAGASSEAIGLMENFWPRITREIHNLSSVSNKKQYQTNFIS